MSIFFKAIEVADREAITSFTRQSPYRNCDFSFANMCSWRFLYRSEYAMAEGFLLIRFRIEDDARPVYMFPLGDGNLPAAIRLIEKDAREQGHPLWIMGVTSPGKEKLENAFPQGFRFIPERDYFDYVYLREDLITLSGKKYQAKRNHINKFNQLYRYEYKEITPELVPECLTLECEWYKANRTDDDAEELSHERRSLTFALRHAAALGLMGGVISVEGKIVAFAFGAPINHDTFGVHVEKADIRYNGVYSVMNFEFANHIPPQYIYINREEDLGIPGLRQAKQSWRPAFLLEKHTAVKKLHEPTTAKKAEAKEADSCCP
ncbi:MAG: phosphatidylglycerol lysyltransferase domain-containing protein [Tannerellaceae bacterium]|nr:phosphatidylglycerol lysyltransferase domain-containing protein [Tannerellaceae bacterium]